MWVPRGGRVVVLRVLRASLTLVCPAVRQAFIDSECVPRIVELLLHPAPTVRPCRPWQLHCCVECARPHEGVAGVGLEPPQVSHPQLSSVALWAAVCLVPAQIVTPALRCIGHLVSGSDLQTQFALDCDVMPALTELLGHTQQTVGVLCCGARPLHIVLDTGAGTSCA